MSILARTCHKCLGYPTCEEYELLWKLDMEVFEAYELKNMRMSPFRVRIKIEIILYHTSCKSMDAYRNMYKECV